MSGTITSANVVFMLSVAGLYTTPVQLQGFSADDIFDVEDVDTAEVQMGADGYMVSGWVPAMNPMKIMFLAASPSISIFETWDASQTTNRISYSASATVAFPATGTIYSLPVGFLTKVSRMPSAGKVLKPRSWTIVWQSITPGPQ